MDSRKVKLMELAKTQGHNLPGDKIYLASCLKIKNFIPWCKHFLKTQPCLWKQWVDFLMIPLGTRKQFQQKTHERRERNGNLSFSQTQVSLNSVWICKVIIIRKPLFTHLIIPKVVSNKSPLLCTTSMLFRGRESRDISSNTLPKSPVQKEAYER